MFVVRFFFAISIVYLLAPEQSAKLMRDMLEGVEVPAAIAAPSADQLVTFCRSNPETCRDLANSGAGLAAMGLTPKTEKPPTKRVTSTRD